jgi:hypothetical protein
MEVRLTKSQVRQLIEVIEDKRHDDSILLRELPDMGSGYLELVLVAGEDKEIAKRILFPV